jgi:hypothetical protein
MRVQLDVKGYSQYDSTIKESYQSSSCGPVTVYTILKYSLPQEYPYDVNQLYKLLGSTRIGLFTWRLKRNLRKLLGSEWEINTCSIEEILEELQAGRPVAAKFDQYFTFNYFKKYEFGYHWVPLIGFEKNENGLTLILHDNGGRNRESRIRYVSYEKNQDILTFAKIYPHSNFD